jgi:hypothetical protein
MQDLVIGQEPCLDMFGRASTCDVYEKYWTNFCRHTDHLKTKIVWDSYNLHSKDPYQKVIDDELAKHGAVFKRTKEYKGNYIKFKSHKHLTMFILKWS